MFENIHMLKSLVLTNRRSEVAASYSPAGKESHPVSVTSNISLATSVQRKCSLKILCAWGNLRKMLCCRQEFAVTVITLIQHNEDNPNKHKSPWTNILKIIPVIVLHGFNLTFHLSLVTFTQQHFPRLESFLPKPEWCLKHQQLIFLDLRNPKPFHNWSSEGARGHCSMCPKTVSLRIIRMKIVKLEQNKYF